MKNSGLRNRFSNDVREVWAYWYNCAVCGLNQWDVLHHIMSPSVHDYVDGEHNTSVLNSCPIHNYRHPGADHFRKQGYSGKGIDSDCHINNEAWLGQNYRLLLRKVKDALDSMDYVYKPIDLEFLRIYKNLYE